MHMRIYFGMRRMWIGQKRNDNTCAKYRSFRSKINVKKQNKNETGKNLLVGTTCEADNGKWLMKCTFNIVFEVSKTDNLPKNKHNRSFLY